MARKNRHKLPPKGRHDIQNHQTIRWQGPAVAVLPSVSHLDLGFRGVDVGGVGLAGVGELEHHVGHGPGEGVIHHRVTDQQLERVLPGTHRRLLGLGAHRLAMEEGDQMSYQDRSQHFCISSVAVWPVSPKINSRPRLFFGWLYFFHVSW